MAINIFRAVVTSSSIDFPLFLAIISKLWIISLSIVRLRGAFSGGGEVFFELIASLMIRLKIIMTRVNISLPDIF